MNDPTDPTDPPARAVALFRKGDVEAARQVAEDALAQSGETAPLRHFLGVISCRCGDLEEGISHLERAAELVPHDPATLLMLMRALIDAGRPRDALLRPFRGDELPKPVLLTLWRTRAEAAHLADDMHQEADALERIVVLDPADSLARDLLVQLLLSLGRPEAALKQINFMPLTRDRERMRSLVLSRMRRFDEATAVDAAILDADPQDFESWLSLVVLADQMADRPRLLTMAEKAEDAGFPRAELDFVRSLIAKLEGQTEKALALARTSEVRGEPARRFGLIAVLADRLGHADEAFDAATAKAQAMPDIDAWRRRAKLHRTELERVAAATTPEWVAGWSPPSSSIRPSPVFLVGFPRSGTTLLDTFLMGHPKVTVVEEEQMLAVAAQEFGDAVDLGQADPATIAKARTAYFAELDRHQRPSGATQLVIDKLPLGMSGAAYIHRLFPDARIIFAQRHPADSVLSNFLQSFRMNDAMANFLDIGDAAQFYDVAMRLWVRSREELRLNVLDLVYEELVEDPEAALRPVVDWLGLSWDATLLDHRRTAANRGTIVTPSYDQVTQPIHRRAVGRWKHYAERLAPILPLLDRWAQHLGYGPMTTKR